MTESRGRDRTWQRAVALGVILSVALHVALFGWLRLDVNVPAAETGRALVVVPLAPDASEEIADRPLEVVEIRESARVAAAGARSAAAPRAEAVPLARLASAGAVSSALAVQPVRFLEALELPEEEEDVVSAYSRVSDFLVEGRASPQGFRPIDDRPVSVLAGLAAVRGGGGVVVSGGYCPPGHGGGILR
ncbi:MAG: hypothetical protein RRA92_06905 [Gemmatimonadota bacterium]|nr:hypothetical protein [Gemmatimonadota bacterium]